MESPSSPGAATVFNGLDIVIDPTSCLNFRPDLGPFHPLHKAHYVVESCALMALVGMAWMNQNVGQSRTYMQFLGEIRRGDA